VDSFRFVVCARADCRQVFFLCRRCDRGDRYCSRGCANRARRATLHAAGRRYQHSWPGRLRHAARQADVVIAVTRPKFRTSRSPATRPGPEASGGFHTSEQCTNQGITGGRVAIQSAEENLAHTLHLPNGVTGTLRISLDQAGPSELAGQLIVRRTSPTVKEPRNCRHDLVGDHPFFCPLR
jgi:hypothetical protein